MDKTKMAIAIFDSYAEMYQEKYMDITPYKDSLDLFCGLLTKELPEVLEVACGPGNITKYLLENRPDTTILATDLSTKMIALARVNNPLAVFKLLDCREIHKIDRKYDGLMCGFCLPYLSKEESIKLIKDASDLLNPGGVLYISTMEGDYSTSGLRGPSNGGSQQLYMYFHEATYLIDALNEHSFKIIEIIHKDFLTETAVLTKDLIIIAKREY